MTPTRRPPPRATFVLLLLPLCTAAVASADAWPTRGHDTRRTGQSSVVGPSAAGRVDKRALPEGQAINMAPMVSEAGTVYVGTWGVVRSFGAEDPRAWDKLDGKLYALQGDGLDDAWAGPFLPDVTPYCYDYQDRADPGYCPMGGMVTYYNGTVEGTPALSADGATLYVGRGDGKIYAVDAATGARRWVFSTFNPQIPDDPDGGGEVISGMLVGGDGTIYAGTVRVGPNETNALYAVKPDGSLRWRYPASGRGIDQVIWAAPMLSPDGATVYFAGSWGPEAGVRSADVPGRIYAFHTATGQLKWTFDPRSGGADFFTFTASVGADGALYLAGAVEAGAGLSAAVMKVEDRGASAGLGWPAARSIAGDEASMAFGLALAESGGATTRVYAASGNLHGVTGYLPGGVLMALAPADGAPLWTFDPEAHGGAGAMNGIAIDGAGTVYTGVSGRSSGGQVYAVRPDGSLLWKVVLGGLLEWGHPVLGPDGAVYAAETRRCAWNWVPIEDGLCEGVDIDPAVYAIREAEDEGGCATAGGRGVVGWGWLAGMAAVAARRRRRG